MQAFIDFFLTIILPLAALLCISHLVRRALPNPFSGGCGG